MYSLYILVFLLLVAFIYKRKWFPAGIMFLLAYWLQMLTLILPPAILIWALWQKNFRLAGVLLVGLALIGGLDYYLGVDFFGSQFLGWPWPPHWQYLNWWWLAAIIVLALKREKYILSIIGVYLSVLAFFTRPDPGGAYLIALWPLTLWPLLNWKRWVTILVCLIVMINFVSKINHLYFNRDGRAQIKSAYTAIINDFEPGDKIYAVQLRDYYLQDLPAETNVIDLQENTNPEFSGSGFVVWEQEKSGHFKPEVLNYIRTNFKHLAGEGLDNWGVEIYSFGK